MEFKCSRCEKIFKYKRARNRHEESHHSNFSRRECPSCGKIINRKDNFDRHLRTCQNFTKCPYCEDHFQQSNQRRLHIQTKHRDHLFKCENCQTTFLTLRNFDRHKERSRVQVSIDIKLTSFLVSWSLSSTLMRRMGLSAV